MRLRAPQAEDAPAVSAVLAARDIADLGRPDGTLEHLRDQWRAGDFELATDAVVAQLDDGRIAEHGDTIAGFLLALHEADDSVGYVDLLAVHPDHHRRGLGTALLTTAFALFAAAGLKQAELGVASDNPPALALYERLGMKPRFQADTYERTVEA
jgi:ribosomal protein S18 acetylase RimI-like enzyme